MLFRLVGLLLASACVSAAQVQTILVLPFANSGSAPQLDWISESLPETLRESLAAAGLFVLDRDERQQAMRKLSLPASAPLTRASAFKAGQSMDAELVVYGEFLFTPAAPDAASRGNIRILAVPLDVERLTRGSELVVEGPLEELASLQGQLAWKVMEALAPALLPPPAEFKHRAPALRLDALESYVRGLLNPDAREKYRYLSQAARLDARFSMARFELGRLQLTRNQHRDAAEWLAQIPEVDSHYTESLFLQGLARYHAGEFALAEKAFAMALERIPLGEVLNNLGAAQARQNRLAEAQANYRRAIDGDSSDADSHFNLGYLLWRKGEPVLAAAHLQAALERNPEDAEAAVLLGFCQKGDRRSALESRWQGRERLKSKLPERAYRQLKALLERKKP
jgi:tetratricopeptide (TPR) repeat protein